MHKPWCIWITVTKFCTNPLYHLADFLYLQNVVKKFSYQQHYVLVPCVHRLYSAKTLNIFPLMVSVRILCPDLDIPSWFLLIQLWRWMVRITGWLRDMGHFARASVSLLPDWWRWPFERTINLWMVPLWSTYRWQSSRGRLVATASA